MEPDWQAVPPTEGTFHSMFQVIMKILIADDDQTTRRILLAVLKKAGFEVVICCDGCEALQALQSEGPPMLAILDWMMPGMDGVDICRTLRTSEAAVQPYLILLTCKGFQEDVVSGLESGADDYIVKPFSADELLARIKVGQRVLGLQSALAARVEELTKSNQSLAEAQAIAQLGQQQLLQAEKMAALGFLLAGIAHEINNPNGLILLNFPVLMEAFRDAEPILEKHYHDHGDFSFAGLPYSKMREELPEMFDDLLESARRIKRIVDDLKNFTRRDDASFEETLDLNELVQTSLRLMGTMLRDSTENFSAQYADALPKIKGNGQRIEQVVVNLLMNACQALEDKSQRITVQTSFDEQKGMVEFLVKDEGVGILPEHVLHLTSPFFTTKREKGGTGLGLSLSERIVTGHGGTLTFASEQGKGTTVRVALPAQKER
ncbi:MAG: response regulator [Geobacter sp.]|nr:MAG: response regulator [Geobacter sp.]